jgi:hypothetical protein
MMRRFLAAIALFAWLPSAVSAQEQTPSDRELKAGYCLGWFRARSQDRNTYCAGAVGTPLACPSDLVQQQDDELKRVTLYLMAKGLPGGAIIAAGQGARDWKQCFQTLQAPQTQSCSDTCFARSLRRPDDVSRCIEACKPDVCKRGGACDTMDYLPY